MLYLVVLVLVCVVIVYFRVVDMVKRKQMCLSFIEKYNSGDAEEIIKAIMAHKRTFPPELVTALIWGESMFYPRTVADEGNGLGLGCLNPEALDEIERYYKIKVDRARLFEVDYNVYLTCLFLHRSKVAAKRHKPELYLYYRTILTYKDWLTWTNATYNKADRTWETYNTLRYGYQKYGRRDGDVK